VVVVALLLVRLTGMTLGMYLRVTPGWWTKPEDLSAMRQGAPTWQSLMSNGGFDDARLAQINRAIGGLENMGETGG